MEDPAEQVEAPPDGMVDRSTLVARAHARSGRNSTDVQYSAVMRSTTAEDYLRRLNRALDFIARHLDRPFSIGEVAAEAAFSRFHCQRMFRAMTGESIVELVRRFRLERAGYRLRRESVNVIEVALEAGYGSEEAFSRAFRRCCGLSPSQYRTATPPPAFGSPAARGRYCVSEARVVIDIPMGGISMEVRIETFDDIKVARVRHVGHYGEVSQCFERLFEWVAAMGVQPGRVLTLSHDDPDDIAIESLRSDACVELHTDASPPPGISIDKLGAGRYAIYTYRGPYDSLGDAYKRLFETWLPQSGEEVDDRPCMEIYRNNPRDTAPDELLTDVCLPLREAPKEADGAAISREARR